MKEIGRGTTETEIGIVILVAEVAEVASKTGEAIGMIQGGGQVDHVVRAVETEIVEEVRFLLFTHPFSLY
jgi:hypothetical protein